MVIISNFSWFHPVYGGAAGLFAHKIFLLSPVRAERILTLYKRGCKQASDTTSTMREVITDAGAIPATKQAATSAMSKSLIPRPIAEYNELERQFAERHPAQVPPIDSLEWSSGPYVTLMDKGTGKKTEVQTPVATIMLWFQEGKVRIEFSAPKGENDFLNWCEKVFGPGGLLAEAMPGMYKSLVGSAKLPGLGNPTAKKLKDAFERDATAGTGQKPVAFPQPYKVREMDDGTHVHKFVVTHYFSQKPRAGAEDRPDIPPEVEEAFEGLHHHPCYQHFAANPGLVPKPLVITLAHGTETNPWKIIRDISNEGKKGWYGKCMASVTVGGLGCRYAAGPNTIIASGYINGPKGVRVFAKPQSGADRVVAADPQDEDVYDNVSGTKRSHEDMAAGDEDVYAAAEQSDAKQAKH